MQLQSKIVENADDVRYIYTITKEWRTKIALAGPKSLVPKSNLLDGSMPTTNTVVSSRKCILHIIKLFSFEYQWVNYPNSK